jgi:hypothetical protein
MILGVLNLCGCIKDYQNGKLISEQRHFPKEPRFTIRPNGTDAYSNSVLDFEAIYLQKVIFNKKDYGYNYFRFWPNGCVLARLEDVLPSREQAESFMGVPSRLGLPERSQEKIPIRELKRDLKLCPIRRW